MAFGQLLHRLHKRKGNQRNLVPHMRHGQREELQRQLNRFTKKYLVGVTPLRVDGAIGPATRKRIKQVKYYLGWNRRTPHVSELLLRELNHPRWAVWSNPARLARAKTRRRAQRKHERKAQAQAARGGGLVTFDGKPVVAWIAHRLQWARERGWPGTVTSGYRTPEYSEHLCEAMCGAPSCPGRCAGRTTNHAKKGFPNGAVDVTYYLEFASFMRRYDREHPGQPSLHNDLPIDRVHFSATGH